MGRARILVALAPRSYREAIARAIALSRPAVETVDIAPEALTGAIGSLKPDLVLYSPGADLDERIDVPWIALYPDGESYSVVNLDGERGIIADIEFADLLRAVDRVSAAIAASSGLS